MKKIIIILLAVLLMAVDIPQESSWYRQQNGVTELTYSEWITFTPAMFDLRREGFYIQSGDWFTTTTANTSLVKLSGNCTQPKGYLVKMRLLFTDGRAEHVIASSDAGVIAFVDIFAAGTVQIQAWSANYVELKCNLLFELVK